MLEGEQLTQRKKLTKTEEMGRAKKNFEQMPARFAEGTLAKMDEVLKPGQTRTEFVRNAVDAAIQRERKRRKKNGDEKKGGPQNGEGE